MGETPPLGEKTITGPVEPIHVAIVGTGDGGLPATGTVATTPGTHNPNLVVNIVSPLVALVVRFINVYIGNLVGLVTAGMTSNAIPAADFQHLVEKCAGLAVAGAVILTLKDIVTIFAGLEKKFPLGTGSV
jgi:hypothetical protein